MWLVDGKSLCSLTVIRTFHFSRIFGSMYLDDVVQSGSNGHFFHVPNIPQNRSWCFRDIWPDPPRAETGPETDSLGSAPTLLDTTKQVMFTPLFAEWTWFSKCDVILVLCGRPFYLWSHVSVRNNFTSHLHNIPMFWVNLSVSADPTNPKNSWTPSQQISQAMRVYSC